MTLSLLNLDLIRITTLQFPKLKLNLKVKTNGCGSGCLLYSLISTQLLELPYHFATSKTKPQPQVETNMQTMKTFFFTR